MTVGELIEKIKDIPKDTPIYTIWDLDSYDQITNVEKYIINGHINYLFLELDDIPNDVYRKLPTYSERLNNSVED